jgi:hypothetical protein
MEKDKKDTGKFKIITTSNLPGLKGVPVIVPETWVIRENSSKPRKK